MADITVALDAGHGGSDSGAVYGNRKEKDDVLKLSKAVGEILEENGIKVYYVRTDDEYETPFKKATDANNSGADYFVSLHRNSSETPNQYNGVETLVYNDEGIKAIMARNINKQLEKVGYKNLGVDERPNLVVLKRTKMPAVLVEVGFINDQNDNKIFDDNFNAVAQGIADGVLDTVYGSNQASSSSYESIPVNIENNDRKIAKMQEEVEYMPNNEDYGEKSGTSMNLENMNKEWKYDENNDGDSPEKLYRVQVGAYRNKESADRMLNSLLIEGFPAFIVYDDGIYKVQVGAFRLLANAIKMEEKLRRFRYNTYITV